MKYTSTARGISAISTNAQGQAWLFRRSLRGFVETLSSAALLRVILRRGGSLRSASFLTFRLFLLSFSQFSSFFFLFFYFFYLLLQFIFLSRDASLRYRLISRSHSFPFDNASPWNPIAVARRIDRIAMKIDLERDGTIALFHTSLRYLHVALPRRLLLRAPIQIKIRTSSLLDLTADSLAKQRVRPSLRTVPFEGSNENECHEWTWRFSMNHGRWNGVNSALLAF